MVNWDVFFATKRMKPSFALFVSGNIEGVSRLTLKEKGCEEVGFSVAEVLQRKGNSNCTNIYIFVI